MILSQVLKLIDAGFSKDEIGKLLAADDNQAAGESEKAQAGQDPGQAQAAGDPQGEPEKQPDKPSEPTEIQKLVDALGLKLDNLQKQITQKNVNSIEGKGEAAETSDSILARIINPKWEG